MCGVFGVQNHPEAAKMTFLGLFALQHRGEESAGIATFDGQRASVVKAKGLVEDVVSTTDLAALKGHLAIGHVRYSTTGSSNRVNVQPFMVNHRNRTIAVAHNGNLTNTRRMCDALEKTGSILQTSMDSEILVHLLAKTHHAALSEQFIEALGQVEGAYSATFMINDILVGVKDPYGVRPLWLGKLGDSYLLSSETCAFDLVGAEKVRELDEGEILFIEPDGRMESVFLPARRKAHCIFEQIYFARPDSQLFGNQIYTQRKKLGRMLAKEAPCDADMVMPVPDSGNYAALGYAEESGLPFELGIVRNHYIGRTFIDPTQMVREFKVKIKLNPIRSLIEGKKIVLVEDSVVRGTTSRNRIQTLRECGAKEIHLRVSCPPIISPCYYGIDFPTKDELIGAKQSIEGIQEFIGVDSLAYLSLDGMTQALNGEDQRFCDACFSGNYPIEHTSSSKHVLEQES